jgi:hypothetical protein
MKVYEICGLYDKHEVIRNAFKICLENLKEDLDVDGRIILGFNVSIWGARAWAGFTGPR